MNKNKKLKIFASVFILLMLGILCLAVASIENIKINDNLKNMIGFSSFTFWISALVVLIKNFSLILTLDILKEIEKEQQETSFFTYIPYCETPKSLKIKFEKIGFKQVEGFFHKRQFSLTKDYINYYMEIVFENPSNEYFDKFAEKYDNFLSRSKIFCHNNYIYCVFFISNATNEMLSSIQEYISNQYVLQGIPTNTNTILPIIYDISHQRYIIRSMKHRFSIRPIQTALKNFYKIIIYKNAHKL